MEITKETLRAHVIAMVQEGRDLDFMQKIVNAAAPKLAAQFPEVAEKNPKMIGAMAKASVMGTWLTIAFGDEEKALQAIIKHGYVTEEHVTGDHWKGLLVALLGEKAERKSLAGE